MQSPTPDEQKVYKYRHFVNNMYLLTTLPLKVPQN